MNAFRHSLLVALGLLSLEAPVAMATAFRRTLVIDRVGKPAVTNVQVPIVITASNFTYSHIDADGSQIRFNDTDRVTALPYYRESWNFGGTSIFWVRVPSIPASTVKYLYVDYSSAPGEVNATSSDFSSTFTNSYTAPSGTVTLTPTSGADAWENVDWFMIGPGSTVNVGQTTSLQPFTVNARRILISGQLLANGAGGQPNQIPFTAGNGPGPGQPAANGAAGAGGGGHGNSGGRGGSNASQSSPPGMGGPAYGAPANNTNFVGSAGGTGSLPGAAGGGAIQLSAHRLDMTGTLSANGNNAPDGIYCGGGGSGGGILLLAHNLNVTGSIFARGGWGGGFTGGATAGGGGGAGGRIKLFYENSSSGTPTLSVTGGASGMTGFDPPPEPGGAGTTHTGLASDAGLGYDEVSVTMQIEHPQLSVEHGAVPRIQVGSPMPNPSRGGVQLAIEVHEQTRCEVDVVDLQGRRVKALERSVMAPGVHEVSWDASDESGRAVPAGLYLARVTLAGQVWTRRIVVAR